MRRGRWVLIGALWWVVGGWVLTAGPVVAATSWTWPLDGGPAVGRSFDPPADRYGRGHRGVDLAAAPGAPVLAAGAGRVSYAGLLAGRGVVVVVHGDLRTTYEPVDASVAVGQLVAAGESLGTLAAGHAGCASPACLHWGLRRGEQYLDPLSLVGGGPVRLLPLGGEPGDIGAATGGAAEPAPPAAPAAPSEPTDVRAGQDESSLDWRLRSAATPSGAVAVVALVAGIALLRPRRPPQLPGGAGAGAASAERADDLAAEAGAVQPDPSPPGDLPPDVVDLNAERDRRRASG